MREHVGYHVRDVASEICHLLVHLSKMVSLTAVDELCSVHNTPTNVYLGEFGRDAFINVDHGVRAQETEEQTREVIMGLLVKVHVSRVHCNMKCPQLFTRPDRTLLETVCAAVHVARYATVQLTRSIHPRRITQSPAWREIVDAP